MTYACPRVPAAAVSYCFRYTRWCALPPSGHARFVFKPLLLIIASEGRCQQQNESSEAARVVSQRAAGPPPSPFARASTP